MSVATPVAAGGDYTKMSAKADGNHPASESLVDNKDEMTISKVRNCKDLWKWFIRDPCSRWPLMFFVIIFLASIVFLIISFVDVSSSYVPAGIAGIICTTFGTYHFKQLIALRAQVDTFEKQNNEFKKENAQLSNEVNRMEKAQIELTETESRLKAFNKQNRENLKRFKTLNDNLSASGTKNIAGMQKIAATMQTVEDKWGDQMLTNEKEMYLHLFDSAEFKDKSEGLSEDEYNDFISHLPSKYKNKIHKYGTFKKLAGDDNVISFDELADVLDQMAKDFIELRESKRASRRASLQDAKSDSVRNFFVDNRLEYTDETKASQ